VATIIHIFKIKIIRYVLGTHEGEPAFSPVAWKTV
jgi:hypothetical protein